MASSKLDKRINDKFYFVLDEVEGSPDAEAEGASDNESKSPNNAPGESKIPDEIPEKEKINQKMDDTNVDSPLDEGEIVDSTPASPEEEQPSINTTLETTVGVVDMDIDTDEAETSNRSEKLSPIMKLTFRDEEVEKIYKDLLLNFLAEKMDPCTVVTSSENSLEIEIYKEDLEKILQKDDLDFELDTAPDYRSRNNRVPYYGKTCDVVLSDKPEIKASNKNANAFASACFNCLENHNMRDCPKPKDFRAINRNRLKFQQNSSKPFKTSRYHLDENQKFSHIVPGVISKKLRNALNLHKDQQPEFIYRMRKLGYPPAWLEEAKVSHSGVAMYNNAGVPVLEDDEEEGEIIPDGAKDKYDITKIIEFPGFNVPLPNHMKDDTKYYKCPPIDEEQSKERMISELQPNAVKAYKKRSLKPAPEEQPFEKDSSTPPSPSIEEMEEKKRKLLMALDDDVGSDIKLSQDDNSLNQETEPEPSQPLPATPAKDVGKIKQLDFGTPVLKSISPFSKLPSREQFSVDVSDVINFENLPNSTGKYETMTHLITKIRETVTKIQNE